ncbi:MAG: methylmalonyl-CoA/ethylmalonyl-CoA epimerase [Actinomycetota bacterium]|jgi:catechol 2,3-dioxygenase-like lactoylglutathione lyase family enzyme|nr:methylmalonyl-CoA/ethylmalonyl-CoA epimerase [Actinomycetota bacterium]
MKLSVNHVGLSVHDLEVSTAFYTSLGGEVIMNDHASGPGASAALDVDDVDLHSRMIRFGSVIVELLEYRSPVPRPYQLRNSDVGAAHVAFEVVDLRATYVELSERGVTFNSPPNAIEEGDFAGGWMVYAKDPDGLSVEFLQPGPGFAEVLRAGRR